MAKAAEEMSQIERMRQQATIPNQDNEEWKPEPGDELLGVISESKVVKTDDGPKPLIIVMTSEGDYAVWTGGACLRQAMADKQPGIGDTIYLRYVEEKKIKNGRKMKFYAVAIDYTGDGRGRGTVGILPENGYNTPAQNGYKQSSVNGKMEVDENGYPIPPENDPFAAE